MKFEAQKNFILITLEGGFDEARGLSSVLDDVQAGQISRNIIMDVRSLELIQSFQIGLIIKAKTVSDKLGGQFRLLGDSEEILDILEVVDLGVVVQRFGSLPEAVASLER